MKRIALVLVLSTLIFSANAQAGKTVFGVKAGMTIANLTSDMNGDAKVGMVVGATMDYGISDNVLLLTGLNFKTQGTRNLSMYPNMGKAKYAFSYLELPIQLGYRLNIASETTITIHAGPYYYCAVSGERKSNGVSQNLYNKHVQDNLAFKMIRFDFGLGLGADIDWRNLCVGFNFDGGFVNMIKNVKPNIYEWSTLKTHNVCADITVGYKF